MADTVRFPDEVRASFTGELIGPGEAGMRWRADLAFAVNDGQAVGEELQPRIV